jgi:hypothetical protein
MPKNRWVTREANAGPHLLLPCSFVIKCARTNSPLTDSAGIRVSTNMPYQTSKYERITDNLMRKKFASTRQEREKNRISKRLSTTAAT